MKKIFILGGSSLQLDLILEAKKMFFYTIVLDYDKKCIGSKWCDEFLHINIADKEFVLEKAKEYKIDLILTSATELGNVTACYVGEKLGLSSNSYQTALNTTNKILMKKILEQNSIKTAKYKVVENIDDIKWDTFPCIIKPSDSSAGRGVYYCENKQVLLEKKDLCLRYSKSNTFIIEEYIEGKQFSVESITTNSQHQIITITEEYIRPIPNIVETHQKIPATIVKKLENKIKKLTFDILNVFNIKFGASHLELRVDEKENIYIVEIASRTGGWRTEMINFAYGLSYSQLLILSALNQYVVIKPNFKRSAYIKLILSEKDFDEYLYYQSNYPEKIYTPKEINIEKLNTTFSANNLLEAKGYYFIVEKEY